MAQKQDTKQREIWVLGVKLGSGREQLILEYLTAGGYISKVESVSNLTTGKPLGVALDISPFSDDGWGLLQTIKRNPETRNIPVLPIFISEKGDVGGVFPVGGFIMQPIDQEYLLERLAVYGMTEEAETWDLQAMIVAKNNDENLAQAVEMAGFEVINGYTGKEAMALAAIRPKYMVFSSLMLPDMSAFELLEKLRMYPYSKNTPLFIFIKNEMKEGEKLAMSREIAHLVSKKQLSCEDFLSFIRRRE